MEQTIEKVRIDKFLWGIRLYKTRTLATEACDSGKVKKEDHSMKPSSMIKIGDIIKIRIDHHVKTICVKKLIEKRVGPIPAAECFEDLTPIEERPAFLKSSFNQPTFYRDSGTGRPTKRQRRNMDDFREQFD